MGIRRPVASGVYDNFDRPSVRRSIPGQVDAILGSIANMVGPDVYFSLTSKLVEPSRGWDSSSQMGTEGSALPRLTKPLGELYAKRIR